VIFLPFSNQQKPEMTVSKETEYDMDASIAQSMKPMDEWYRIGMISTNEMGSMIEIQH
jgi:hypothetical protein